MRAQVGGDRQETYFSQTANIAGIEDARAQELMPDALRFLGITKIDRLLSMSKDKHDALTGSGIEIAKRVSLPETWVPSESAPVMLPAAQFSTGLAVLHWLPQ